MKSITIFLSLLFLTKTSTSNIIPFQKIQDKQQCLVLAVFTAISGYKVYQDFQAKDQQAAVMQFLDTLKLVYLDYNCLSQNLSIKEMVGASSSFKDKQCFIDHFENAGKQLGVVVLDVIEFKFDNVADDFSKVTDILNDALDNC